MPFRAKGRRLQSRPKPRSDAFPRTATAPRANNSAAKSPGANSLLCRRVLRERTASFSQQTGYANLRFGPGNDQRILMRLPNGTELAVQVDQRAGLGARARADGYERLGLFGPSSTQMTRVQIQKIGRACSCMILDYVDRTRPTKPSCDRALASAPVCDLSPSAWRARNARPNSLARPSGSRQADPTWPGTHPASNHSAWQGPASAT